MVGSSRSSYELASTTGGQRLLNLMCDAHPDPLTGPLGTGRAQGIIGDKASRMDLEVGVRWEPLIRAEQWIILQRFPSRGCAEPYVCCHASG